MKQNRQNKTIPKQRNPVVAFGLPKCGGGPHQKPYKVKRAESKSKLKRGHDPDLG